MDINFIDENIGKVNVGLLNNKEIGNTGLCVGNHLTLEGAFPSKLDRWDSERKSPVFNIEDYDIHIWNIQTIVRNLISSYKLENRDKVTILSFSKFKDIIIKELELIQDLYKDKSTKLVLFNPSYEKVLINYNKNKDKDDTVSFEEFKKINDYCKKLDNVVQINTKGTYEFSIDKKTNALFTTHISLDLFINTKFTLLECYTGKLKTKSLFNTRYREFSKKYSTTYLPWCEEIYYLLGDNIMVRYSGLALRKKLFEVAQKKKWTEFTPKEKVRYDLNLDKDLKEYLKYFNRCYS